MAKEKAKERKEAKERKVKRKQDGVIYITPLKTAHVCAGAHARRPPCTCTYAEAGEAAADTSMKELPAETKALLIVIPAIWIVIGAVQLVQLKKNRKKNEK